MCVFFLSWLLYVCNILKQWFSTGGRGVILLPREQLAMSGEFFVVTWKEGATGI